ncbi:MAG: hypothetical protein J0I41_00850 [Filimonas sp.]|nr:hypothetical protein [Filimonas sp.]
MKTVFTVILFLFISFTVTAQKLRGKKEESTNNVVRTTWETLYISGWSYVGIRILKLDSAYTLETRIVLGGKRLSIVEGENLTLKLSNDSTITLPALKTAVSNRGSFTFGTPPRASEGIEVSFDIPTSALPLLQTNDITSLSIDFSKGAETVEVKEQNRDVLKKCLEVLK